MLTLYRIAEPGRGMKRDVTDLQSLVTALDQDRPLSAPPVWVRVHGPLACPTRIDHDKRLHRLVGFSAPRSCTALGVVAGGWAMVTGGPGGQAAPVEGPDGALRAAHPPPRERIRTAVLMARDGTVAGRLRWPSGRVSDDAPESGRVFDCLRRALGLATAPPAVGTEVLFASMWLAAISGATGRAGSPPTWAEAMALHPVAQLIGDRLPGPDGWLVDAARAFAVACPWSEVRRLIGEGGWEEHDVPSAAAAWMDDGMVSRWLLDGRATLSEQLEGTALTLEPDVAARVRRTLRQLGLLGQLVSPLGTRRSRCRQERPDGNTQIR